MKRVRVGVIFGGRSAEHEVSLRSAASVIAAVDLSKYDVVPIKIEKDGHWRIPSSKDHSFLQGIAGAESIDVALLADPSSPGLLALDRQGVWKPLGKDGRLDVVFPVLHGTYGEDGTVQGLLELAGVPFVGAGTAASAVGMDKEMMKALFRERGIPVVRHAVVYRLEWERSPEEVVSRVEAATLGYPVFAKPARLGSSVGVSKVRCREALARAFEQAFAYDRKALVEQGVEAREIEVSVLGNDEPVASIPGEIVPSREFYDYRAKYIDDTSRLLIPAPLGEETRRKVQELGVAAFRAVDASGMARVDFFLERSGGALYVNEINTIPGFTSISMYPKLWEASGLPMPELVDRLIQLALEKARERTRIETSYPDPCRSPA